MSQIEKKKLVSIKTDDTLMETATHGTHLFPFRFYDENMSDFDFNCIDWHWHAEFEFVYIEAGMVHFHIGEIKCIQKTTLQFLIFSFFHL